MLERCHAAAGARGDGARPSTAVVGAMAVILCWIIIAISNAIVNKKGGGGDGYRTFRPMHERPKTISKRPTRPERPMSEHPTDVT